MAASLHPAPTPPRLVHRGRGRLSRPSVLGMSACIIATGLVGCTTTQQAGPDPQTPPQPEVTRPGTSGPANTELSATLMQQFADTAARDLVVKLPQAVADQPTKVLLAFAPIDNRSGLKEAQLQLINQRLQSKLLQAPSIRDSFIALSGEYEDASKLLEKFQPESHGELDPTGDGRGGQPTQYDPNLIYYLHLTAIEASGGDQRMIDLHLRLLHPLSRRTLLSTPLSARLQWLPARGGWVVVQP